MEFKGIEKTLNSRGILQLISIHIPNTLISMNNRTNLSKVVERYTHDARNEMKDVEDPKILELECTNRL